MFEIASTKVRSRQTRGEVVVWRSFRKSVLTCRFGGKGKADRGKGNEGKKGTKDQGGGMLGIINKAK